MSFLATLAEFAQEGANLEDGPNPVSVDTSFDSWVAKVNRWLKKNFPEESYSIEWIALADSPLVSSGGYHDDAVTWHRFRIAVKQRLDWLVRLSKKLKSEGTLPERVQIQANEKGRREVILDARSRAIIDPSRIDDLKNLSSSSFDFLKLIRFCEELNISFATECYLACSMITRAILDHVPPLFGCQSFTEVTNNYKGTKSFKESMLHLDGSSRKIADQHLHSQIRKKEVLPSPKQVDFSQDLDVLLSEIVRLHK